MATRLSPRTLRGLSWQNHHTIPRQVFSKKYDKRNEYPDVIQFLTDIGFKGEDRFNKIGLPDGNVGTPNPNNSTIHRGSHPEYTKYMAASIREIERIGKGLSTEELLAEVNALIVKTQAELISGQRKLNDAVDHSKYLFEQLTYDAKKLAKDTAECTVKEFALGRIPDKVAQVGKTQEHGGVDLPGQRIEGMPDCTDYQLLLPIDEAFSDTLGLGVVNQLLTELVMVGITDYTPYFTLPPAAHNTMMPTTPFPDTLMGQSMQEADIAMKAFIHRAAYFPEGETRKKGLELVKTMDENEAGRGLVQRLEAAGAVNLRTHPIAGQLEAFIDKKVEWMDKHFENRRYTLGKYDGFKMTGYVKGVSSHASGVMLFEPDMLFHHHGKGYLKGDKFPSDYIHTSSDHEHLDHLKQHLGKIDPSIQRHLEILKLVASLNAFVTTLKSNGRIPMVYLSHRQAVQTDRVVPGLVCQAYGGDHIPHICGGARLSQEPVQSSYLADAFSQSVLEQDTSLVRINGKLYVNLSVKTQVMDAENQTPSWYWRAKEVFDNETQRSTEQAITDVYNSGILPSDVQDCYNATIKARLGLDQVIQSFATHSVSKNIDESRIEFLNMVKEIIEAESAKYSGNYYADACLKQGIIMMFAMTQSGLKKGKEPLIQISEQETTTQLFSKLLTHYAKCDEDSKNICMIGLYSAFDMINVKDSNAFLTDPQLSRDQKLLSRDQKLRNGILQIFLQNLSDTDDLSAEILKQMYDEGIQYLFSEELSPNSHPTPQPHTERSDRQPQSQTQITSNQETSKQPKGCCVIA